jgi:hypothetical protein
MPRACTKSGRQKNAALSPNLVSSSTCGRSAARSAQRRQLPAAAARCAARAFSTSVKSPRFRSTMAVMYSRRRSLSSAQSYRLLKLKCGIIGQRRPRPQVRRPPLICQCPWQLIRYCSSPQ